MSNSISIISIRSISIRGIRRIIRFRCISSFILVLLVLPCISTNSMDVNM